MKWMKVQPAEEEIIEGFRLKSWDNIIPKKAWYDAIDEANEMINDDVEVDIQGYDIDGEVLRAARENAKEAGVDHLIHFQERAVKDLRHPKKYGFIITNFCFQSKIRK